MPGDAATAEGKELIFVKYSGENNLNYSACSCLVGVTCHCDSTVSQLLPGVPRAGGPGVLHTGDHRARAQSGSEFLPAA